MLFIGIFRFFPYITLVNFCFQATGHNCSHISYLGFVVWCLAQVCQTQGVDHISNDGLSINAHLASYYIATWVCRGEEGSNPVSLPLVFFMAYIKTSTAGPRPAPRATGTLRFTAE